MGFVGGLNNYSPFPWLTHGPVIFDVYVWIFVIIAYIQRLLIYAFNLNWLVGNTFVLQIIHYGFIEILIILEVNLVFFSFIEFV